MYGDVRYVAALPKDISAGKNHNGIERTEAATSGLLDLNNPLMMPGAREM